MNEQEEYIDLYKNEKIINKKIKTKCVKRKNAMPCFPSCLYFGINQPCYKCNLRYKFLEKCGFWHSYSVLNVKILKYK